MDETQKRKVSAKDFLEQNKKIGFIVGTIFVSIFVIYLAFVFFYGYVSEVKNAEVLAQVDENGKQVSFIERLFPTFGESANTPIDYDENGLPIFKNSSTTNIEEIIKKGEEGESDGSKILQIEKEPILAYVVFPKKVSVKVYIKKKPKICDQKLEIVLKKDEESVAVENFQKMLKSVPDFENTPESKKLDEATREQLFIFQKRYGDIVYKGKKDKEPTRTIDNETVHFLNLLCGFDKELPTDFIEIPTIRYSLRENRQVYDYNILTKEKTLLETKLATGTVEAIFSPNAEYIVYRKAVNDEIQSELVSLKSKNRVNLEKNIRTLAFSGRNILAYGVKGVGGMNLKAYDPDRNEMRKMANLPLNEWNIFWQTDTLLGIYNKPSANAKGIFMTLDLINSKLRLATNPKNALSAIRTKQENLNIVSVNEGGKVKTLLINNLTKNVGDFGINTFAEKCAEEIEFEGAFCAVPKELSGNFSWPDDWYKGRVKTEDVLVYKSISGTSTKIISQLEDKPISIINLKVDKSGIFFIDENTMTLYSVGV